MTKNNDTKTALVTGANRGLGYGCVKEFLKAGYNVIATARDLANLKEVAAKDSWPADATRLLLLDVSNEESLRSFEDQLASTDRIDVLINNAGIYKDKRDGRIFGTSGADFFATMMTNVYGPFRVCQIVLPHMLKRKSGRIVNVSSGMGQLSQMEGSSEAYRTSKTALNALTATLAAELRGTDILVNSVCPGWVQTDMGGAAAPRKLEDGVKSIMWAAKIEEGGPSGGFFRDGKRLAW